MAAVFKVFCLVLIIVCEVAYAQSQSQSQYQYRTSDNYPFLKREPLVTSDDSIRKQLSIEGKKPSVPRWSLDSDGLKHNFKNGVSVYAKPYIKYSEEKPYVKLNKLSLGVIIPLGHRRGNRRSKH